MITPSRSSRPTRSATAGGDRLTRRPSSAKERRPSASELLRIASAALVLAAWRRPWRLLDRIEPHDRWLIAGLGGVFAAMNACFYLAIDRLPLATVAAIEFIGPIALALAGARMARNVGAVAAVTAGVYLLTQARVAGDPAGVAWAFANAALFTAYIVLAHRVARRPAAGGIDGLAAAMVWAFALIAPIGAAGASAALSDPVALAAGVGVGVSSSVIPSSATSWRCPACRGRPTRCSLPCCRRRRRSSAWSCSASC